MLMSQLYLPVSINTVDISMSSSQMYQTKFDLPAAVPNNQTPYII